VAVGNYWIYADSLFTNDTVLIGIDTVSITGYKIVNGNKRWQLNYSFATSLLMPEFLIKNDSVFTPQYTRTGHEVLGLIFIPPKDSTVFYSMMLGGDAFLSSSVSLKKEKYSVPAGSFDSYALYVYDGGLEKDAHVIVPEVGIVNRTLEGLAYPGRAGFVHKSTLIRYNLVKN